MTKAKQIKENANICFMGSSKKAAFDIPGDLARHWLQAPNPNGKPNSQQFPVSTLQLSAGEA